MQEKFWKQRWQQKKIGFHADKVNTHLKKYLNQTGNIENFTTLLPLCGKTIDLLFLSKQCSNVIGVELISQAVTEFFQENNLDAIQNKNYYEYKNIKVFLEDYFKVTTEHIPNVDLIYDRAALVALPEDMRKNYAQHNLSLMKIGSKILLITLEYPQDKKSGPPFSVTTLEVQKLYAGQCSITLLESIDLKTKNDKMSDLSFINEKVYLIEKIK